MTEIKLGGARERVPLTITLDRTRYEFVLSAAALKEFRSLDEFFEAALRVYQHHIHAVTEYLELQEARGLSREEALRAARCEIFVTRTTTRD